MKKLVIKASALYNELGACSVERFREAFGKKLVVRSEKQARKALKKVSHNHGYWLYSEAVGDEDDKLYSKIFMRRDRDPEAKKWQRKRRRIIARYIWRKRKTIQKALGA